MESFSKCSLEVVISDYVLPRIQEFIEFTPGLEKKLVPKLILGCICLGFDIGDMVLLESGLALAERLEQSVH